ncbi:hypothetical protein ABPG73_014898 [Tetrahymena malaccensis]
MDVSASSTLYPKQDTYEQYTQANSLKSSNLNRKSTKIEYLSQENIQLKEEIQELQNMLRLNKEALKIAVNGVGNTSPGSDNLQVQSTKGKTTDSRGGQSQSGDNPKALNMVLHALYEENSALSRKIEKLTEERNIAQSKAFINEQISEASQKHERELIIELEEKVQRLTQKLRESEKTIHQLERCTPEYDEETGIVIKYRDVIGVNEQTKVMHDEMEKLNAIIAKQKKSIDELKSDRQDLLRLNMSLSQEVVKLKTALQASHTSGRINFDSIAGPAPNAQMLINFHQKLAKNPDDSDEEAEDYSFDQLPDKCEKKVLDKSPMATGEENKINAPSMAIPKLDLTKAKQIMELNAKKSTQQQQLKEAQQGNIQLYIEKIKKQIQLFDQELIKIYQFLIRLEKDIDIARRNLSREMLLNKTLAIQNESLKRQTLELESRNEILINSHQMFEEKWTKIVNAFEFYKEFYKKHVDILSNRKSPQSPNRSILQSDNDNSYDAERILKIKNQQQNICFSQIQKMPSQIQKSLMQVNQDDYKFEIERKQQLIIDGAYSKQDAKDFMVQMAKELYQQLEKNKFDKLTENHHPEMNEFPAKTINALKNTASTASSQRKLKRCFSNTLDYVNQQKFQDELQQMMELQQNIKSQNDKSSILFLQYNQKQKDLSEIKIVNAVN